MGNDFINFDDTLADNGIEIEDYQEPAEHEYDCFAFAENKKTFFAASVKLKIAVNRYNELYPENRKASLSNLRAGETDDMGTEIMFKVKFTERG